MARNFRHIYMRGQEKHSLFYQLLIGFNMQNPEFKIELTLDELSEIHLTMCLRKINLIDERATLKSQTTLDINSRQLARVEPLCYYLESVLREHHSNKEATA